MDKFLKGSQIIYLNETMEELLTKSMEGSVEYFLEDSDNHLKKKLVETGNTGGIGIMQPTTESLEEIRKEGF